MLKCLGCHGIEPDRTTTPSPIQFPAVPSSYSAFLEKSEYVIACGRTQEDILLDVRAVTGSLMQLHNVGPILKCDRGHQRSLSFKLNV
jgi:hypothetical protein